MSSKRTRRRATSEAAAVTRNLMLAPMVMAMRMPILALEAGRSSAPESTSAVTEKMKAMADGMVAAQFAFMRSAMLLPFEMAAAARPTDALVDMANAVTTAALKPAGLQVQRNHRRLKRGR